MRIFARPLGPTIHKNNDKVVKIHPFTINYSTHCVVITQITFSGRPCVTVGNAEYYYTLMHSHYIDNYKPFKLFNSEKLHNQF